jgi:hypothetical protein
MDHLRPFHRLPSVLTGDEKNLPTGIIEEMESGGAQILPDLGPDEDLSYDERVVIVSSHTANASQIILAMLIRYCRTRD